MYYFTPLNIYKIIKPLFSGNIYKNTLTFISIVIFFPCYALYEYGIVIATKIEAQKAKEEAEYQATLQHTDNDLNEESTEKEE